MAIRAKRRLWPFTSFTFISTCRRARPLAAPVAPVYITAPARLTEGARMIPLLEFIDYVIGLYVIVVFAAVIMSWLIGLNVMNAHNPFVRSLWQALTALTEPLLRPIRRMLPDLGGLDISPIILLLALYFVRSVVIYGWLIPALK